MKKRVPEKTHCCPPRPCCLSCLFLFILLCGLVRSYGRPAIFFCCPLLWRFLCCPLFGPHYPGRLFKIHLHRATKERLFIFFFLFICLLFIQNICPDHFRHF